MSRESIRARAEAATPGPWHESWRGIGWEVHLDGTPGRCWSPDERDHRDTHMGQKDTMGDWPEAERDARFIAHARQDIPALLAVADAAESVVWVAGEPGGESYRVPRPTLDKLRAALAALEALP